MRYYLWDKKSDVAGLSAEVILRSCAYLLNEDVIVFTSDLNEFIEMDTISRYKMIFSIDSDDLDEIAKSMIEKKRKFDTRFNPDGLVNINIEHGNLNNLEPDINNESKFEEEYKEPNYKLITTDITKDGIDKSEMTITLNHVCFEEYDLIEELEIMEYFRDSVSQLLDKISDAENDNDVILVELLRRELDCLYDDIYDYQDANNVRIRAKEIYEFDNILMVLCETGQIMFITKEVIDSMRVNTVNYKKHKINDEGTENIQQKNVVINLLKDTNELIERGKYVYVIEL